jgi:phosphatidylglycerophosphate synthase
MTGETSRVAIRLGALALGVALFAGTLSFIDFRTALDTVRHLGLALPVALLFSGLCHLARTWAWAACFPQPLQVRFLHLARVRLSAEALSYLTVSGVAGEPLKVVLLSASVSAQEAAAAVALERLAYLAGTTIIIGIGAVLAMIALPLTPGWFRVFRAFAVAAGAITVITALLVRGRRTYVPWLLRSVDRALGTSLGATRVGRFITTMTGQAVDVVRANPLRLLVLMAATAAAYLFTALEGWVILRAAGAPTTATGAFAVETFSRVTTFASGFIPANLGGLEASSIAAAIAVGAAPGGVALALARRLRGLLWAGVGLAIYPRPFRACIPGEAAKTTNHGVGPMLLYLPSDRSVSVPPSAKLAGLPIAERVVRAAVRAGYSRIVLWAGEDAGQASMTRRLRKLADQLRIRLDVATVRREWEAAMETASAADSVTVIGAGTVVSTALLASAREIPAEEGRSVDVAAGPEWAESGVLRMTAGDARDCEHVAGELAARRDRALPLPSGVDVANKRGMLAIRIVTPAHLAAAEETIRRATYKDTDSVMARLNRRVSLPISVALIPTPLTANQLSVILVAIGFYAGWLFSLGHYWTGVLAAFLSLAASVLDGCDGEIARLKYQESSLGCWIETFGDYSYYLAIFIGLTIGAVRQTHLDAYYWIGGIALVGTLLTFAMLIFLRSRITAGYPEKLSAVMQERLLSRPTLLSRIFVQVSFAATRAGMPYGIMGFALVNALPGIVVLAAIGANVYWIGVAMKMRNLLGGSAVATPA